MPDQEIPNLKQDAEKAIEAIEEQVAPELKEQEPLKERGIDSDEVVDPKILAPEEKPESDEE